MAVQRDAVAAAGPPAARVVLVPSPPPPTSSPTSPPPTAPAPAPEGGGPPTPPSPVEEPPPPPAPTPPPAPVGHGVGLPRGPREPRSSAQADVVAGAPPRGQPTAATTAPTATSAAAAAAQQEPSRAGPPGPPASPAVRYVGDEPSPRLEQPRAPRRDTDEAVADDGHAGVPGRGVAVVQHARRAEPAAAAAEAPVHVPMAAGSTAPQVEGAIPQAEDGGPDASARNGGGSRVRTDGPIRSPRPGAPGAAQRGAWEPRRVPFDGRDPRRVADLAGLHDGVSRPRRRGGDLQVRRAIYCWIRVGTRRPRRGRRRGERGPARAHAKTREGPDGIAETWGPSGSYRPTQTDVTELNSTRDREGPTPHRTPLEPIEGRGRRGAGGVGDCG